MGVWISLLLKYLQKNKSYVTNVMIFKGEGFDTKNKTSKYPA